MNSFGYLPMTQHDRDVMLQTLGLTTTEQLFSDIPEKVRLQRPLNLPKGLSEWELFRNFNELANRNKKLDDVISFLGAGAYQHYIPSAVEAVISRSEFYTAYTPYQPEISQGILQAIFEYQSLTATLFGMQAANASLYDVQTAVGEAALMACSSTRRNRIVISQTVHPESHAVLSVYAKGQNADIVQVPMNYFQTDLDLLQQALSDDVAACIIQYPNFFGTIEDVQKIADMTHACGALLIVSCNPIAMGLLEAPGVLGADIVVADGQSLGNSLSFGGPYVGMIATTKELLRKLPGRIVGQTKDSEGRRGFVLTLQAREQHIRREKASSNICSNQALNALAVSVYLSYLGKQGLFEVASLCLKKAHYAADRFAKAGFTPVSHGSFFHEFVIDLGQHAARILDTLTQEGIFLGYPLQTVSPELQNHVLVAITEVNTKAQIDYVATRLEALR